MVICWLSRCSYGINMWWIMRSSVAELIVLWVWAPLLLPADASLTLSSPQGHSWPTYRSTIPRVFHNGGPVIKMSLYCPCSLLTILLCLTAFVEASVTVSLAQPPPQGLGGFSSFCEWMNFKRLLCWCCYEANFSAAFISLGAVNWCLSCADQGTLSWAIGLR